MATDNRDSGSSGRGATRAARSDLTDDLLYDMNPQEFGEAAVPLQALSPEVRERLKHQLVERLKTPVDTPSWGPDWVRRRDGNLPRPSAARRRWLFFRARPAADPQRPVLSPEQRSDAQIIAQNLEKSRQVAHYHWLYLLVVLLAVGIALLAMFVDYQIIRGDIWTRALSNEFMVVPDSLKSSVFFKSLQVVFAVLAIHFMLKITGAYGRNTLIATAFVLTLVMVTGLGYLVAYNNMGAGTSAQSDHMNNTLSPTRSSIDDVFATLHEPKGPNDGSTPAPQVRTAGVAPAVQEVSLPVPKLSEQSLANADSWLWLAFASVIFFIVSTVAALYMQTAENNVRNLRIAHDYKNRRRQYAQLHLLEMATPRAEAKSA